VNATDSATPIFFDGTTVFRFTTEPVSGWPILTGTVRPATSLEVRRHEARMIAARQQAGTSDEAAERQLRAQAKYFLQHLKTWNSPRELNEESLLALPHYVFNQFEGIVSGTYGLLLGNSDATSPS
jgi:hypothetical protein